MGIHLLTAENVAEDFLPFGLDAVVEEVSPLCRPKTYEASDVNQKEASLLLSGSI